MKTIAGLALSIYAACGVPITALAQTPSFHLVGVPTDSRGSQVTALTSDGSMAAGFSDPGYGFTWTASGGRSDFGLFPGIPGATFTYGISDAGVVVGELQDSSHPPQLVDHAFRWTQSGPLQDLGTLPGDRRSWAKGISGDGSVVVGTSIRSATSYSLAQAFRWTAAGGMQPLGFARPGDLYSEALAVSRDGSTIVGTSQNAGAGTAVPFVWTQQAGLHELPGLPGAPFRSDVVKAVSATGQFLVGGCSAAPTGNHHPAMWVGGVISDLGIPAGFAHGEAEGVSDNGGVIGIHLITNGNTAEIAGVWTPATGTITLAEYLSGNGVQVPVDWTLANCLAVSGDGRSFAGWATSASGQFQGFVATVPAPAGTTLLLIACASVARRRR